MSGTVNSERRDVAKVGAALADACHAGGLSSGYYRAAEEALARIDADLVRATEDAAFWRAECESTGKAAQSEIEALAEREAQLRAGLRQLVDEWERGRSDDHAQDIRALLAKEPPR